MSKVILIVQGKLLMFCEQELILGKHTKLGMDCCHLELWLMFITEVARPTGGSVG